MNNTLRARKLRRQSTEVEKILWSHVRNRNLIGLKFKRQFPIGEYIVDFIFIEKRLIIKIDGSQQMSNQSYDEKRTKYLNWRGYKVIRFWNNEITHKINAVIEKIISETNTS